MEWGEPIFQYTSKDAEEDGVLVNIIKLNKEWKKGLFSHITSNLLETHNYIKDDEINLLNLTELLNQCIHIVKMKSNNFQDFDIFLSGHIETPNGEKVKIFIAQNELNKFTKIVIKKLTSNEPYPLNSNPNTKIQKNKKAVPYKDYLLLYMYLYILVFFFVIL